MSTIGLYDIDFNHSGRFSISLPLMKAYNRLYKEGHQVIMMKPYDNSGRYTKIFYFKDNPALALPKSLTINPDKSKYLGYGFLKESGLSDITKTFAPSFMPYELYSNRIKKPKLFKSISENSILDWREKDFTGCNAGAGVTYIYDRDFLLEEDWKDVFKAVDNNIIFLKTIRPQSYEQAIEFLKLDTTRRSNISMPAIYYGEPLVELLDYDNVAFSCDNDEQLFLFIFAAKICTDLKISFTNSPTNDFQRDLMSWSYSPQISFKDWKGKDFNPSQYLKFKYRLLLKQDPKKIKFQSFKDNYLT